MTGESGVAGEGKRVRVGAACAAHSCLRIARSVVGGGAALSEREARGSGSVEEMLPTLLVCGRASVVVSGEGRLLFVLRVSMVTTLWCALPRYTLNG